MTMRFFFDTRTLGSSETETLRRRWGTDTLASSQGRVTLRLCTPVPSRRLSTPTEAPPWLSRPETLAPEDRDPDDIEPRPEEPRSEPAFMPDPPPEPEPDPELMVEPEPDPLPDPEVDG